jgi:hypothetical protein
VLLCNQSPLMQCPIRFMGGSTTSVEPQLRSNWNKAGRNRNQSYRDQTTAAYPLWAVIPGHYPPNTWLLPYEAGGMASHDNTVLGMATTATLYGGITADAPADIGIDTNTPTGELIAFGNNVGEACDIGINANTPALTASISADNVGQPCDLGISPNTPILGAIASLTITATTIGVTGDTCTILPVDDTSPARTATATFGFDGSWAPYATGSMEGSTAEVGVTIDNIVTGVWSAAATGFNTAGTMGNKLNSASSAGDPWSTTLPGSYAAGEAGKILGDIKAKTDSLTFTVPGKVDANIKSVADTAVDGAGTTNDPWGPA